MIDTKTRGKSMDFWDTLLHKCWSSHKLKSVVRFNSTEEEMGWVGEKANLRKQEIDEILKFGTEELFKEEEDIGEDGESANDIVYAVSALLDQSQEGVEEKEDWSKEYP